MFTVAEAGENVADAASDAHIHRLSVEAALAQLPEEQRMVVALVLVEGYAYKEAAEVVEVPIGTVTSRLARARETLEACSVERKEVCHEHSRQKLMAYADGELDPVERAQVEAAIGGDPSLARRVEKHRALRSKVSSAFNSVLDEPVPERLLNAVRGAPAAARDDRGVDPVALLRRAAETGWPRAPRRGAGRSGPRSRPASPSASS